MAASVSTKLARAERRIDALCGQQLPTQHLVEGIAEELRAAMPVDAMIVAATDPDTLLALGAGVVQGMPQSMCHPFWEYEFEVPDFNKFTDLARGPQLRRDALDEVLGRKLLPAQRVDPPRRAGELRRDARCHGATLGRTGGDRRCG